MNHGKGALIGQLTPVEKNRLTVSNTVSIDEPADGYMEMMGYRNSARGHLIAPENKSAMECCLEKISGGTATEQKAYGTLIFSLQHAETVDQMQITPKILICNSDLLGV